MATGFNPPLIFQKATDAEGNPAPGAKLYHYVTESTITKDVFADIALTIPLPQPLVAYPDGSFQQYFMESGYYKFVLYDKDNNQLLPPQDHVRGSGSDSGFPTPSNSGYLHYDVDTNTFTWIESTDDHKVGATATDPSPDFLNQKIASTDTIVLEVVSQKLQARFIGPNIVGVTSDDADPDFLAEKVEDTDSIHWSIAGYTGGGQHLRAEVQPGAGDTYKFKYDNGDLPGFLGDKIAGGTGIVLTTTYDSIKGTIVHISATNTANGRVKVDTSDVTPGFLEDKITAGSGIVMSNVDIGGGYRELRVSTTPLGYQQDVKDFTNKVRTTTTAPIDVLSLTLTAGTWEVCGSASAYVQPAGGLNVAGIALDITSTPGASLGGAIPTDGYDVYQRLLNTTTAMTVSGTVSMRRFVLTATTTVYLNAQCRFGDFSYADFWGNLTARQIA